MLANTKTHNEESAQTTVTAAQAVEPSAVESWQLCTCHAPPQSVRHLHTPRSLALLPRLRTSCASRAPAGAAAAVGLTTSRLSPDSCGNAARAKLRLLTALAPAHTGLPPSHNVDWLLCICIPLRCSHTAPLTPTYHLGKHSCKPPKRLSSTYHVHLSNTLPLVCSLSLCFIRTLRPCHCATVPLCCVGKAFAACTGGGGGGGEQAAKNRASTSYLPHMEV